MSKRQELAQLRLANPGEYPVYLDELLDSGSIHIYDHLIKMKALSTRNERSEMIRKLPFSEIAHVTLEIRDAIIQSVKNAMPDQADKVVFLLGPTGSRKSTGLCALRGDRMELTSFDYISKNDNGDIIGHSLSRSGTLLPTVEMVDGVAYVDYAGFEDSNGEAVRLGMEFALKALVKEYNPKVLVFQSINDINGRFQASAQIGSHLKRLFENHQACTGAHKVFKECSF